MNFKKVTGWLHLWLGLVSGIVVFVECITGACLIFEKDIKEWNTTPVVKEQPGVALLPPSAFYMQDMHELQYSKGRAVLVETEKDEVETTHYFNPYSGDPIPVPAAITRKKDFFTFALDGHTTVWLPKKIGGVVTNYATVIFVILLISGIVLWWPKNKAGLKQRVRFQWKNTTKWKRKNYDLHNILGFYFAITLLLLALTGLRLGGMRWVDKSLYWITSGGKEVPVRKSLFSDTTATALPLAQGMDQLFKQVTEDKPDWRILAIHYPEATAGVIRISAKHYQDRVYDFTDRHYAFDQYTFKLLDKNVWTNKHFPDLIRAVNWDIHMGTIFDMPSKILFFITALIGATLPISGVFIWYGRKKKK